MKLFRILLVSSLMCFGICAFAQQQMPQSPEEQEKQMRELVDKEVEKLVDLLDLDLAQEFYADSILTHDYSAMRDEMMVMSRAKVSNADLYQQVQDKWMEQVYNSFHRMLNDEQWEKYLKNGAGRDKRARDKREAKRTGKK